MKRAALAILAAVIVVTAVVVVTGGVSDDSKSSDEILEESQRRYVGASACMSARERRRLRRISTLMEQTDRVPSDPEFAELSKRAWNLIRPHAPGGSRYDKACYEGAWERFELRVARQR
jgi:hypothetical protein